MVVGRTGHARPPGAPPRRPAEHLPCAGEHLLVEDAAVTSWRPLALLVAGAFFMENLDGTIIGTAAPAMGRSLGVAAPDIGIAMTAYLVTLAVCIPASGWLADRYGSRRVFAAAIGVFTLASVLCALSTSLPELTAVRVLQGVGGAMMVPVGRLVVLRAASKSDLIDAIAYLTWPALLAPVIAPALGGLFASYATWRWIFLVNVPLGLIAFVLSLRMVPAHRDEEIGTLDWPGFLLLAGGLGGIVVGSELAARVPTRWSLVAAGLTFGLVVGAVAARHLLSASTPLIDLRALRIPTLRVSNTGGSLFRIAIAAIPFLVPLLLQEAFGWSAIRSGLAVMAVFVGNVAIKPATGPLLRRFGFRRLLVGIGVATSATIALCAAITATTPLPMTLGILCASGITRSITFTAYNTIAFADVPADALASANALGSAVFQLGIGLGVAVGALALRAGGGIARALDLTGPAMPYHLAFLLLALLPLLAALEAAKLPADAGSALTVGVRREAKSAR